MIPPEEMDDDDLEPEETSERRADPPPPRPAGVTGDSESERLYKPPVPKEPAPAIPPPRPRPVEDEVEADDAEEVSEPVAAGAEADEGDPELVDELAPGAAQDESGATGDGSAQDEPAPQLSPFAPRAAVEEDDGDATEPSDLPMVKNHDRLRLATAAIVQDGLGLEEAAERYGVDADTLFVWHRTFLTFVNRQRVQEGSEAQPAADGAEAHRVKHVHVDGETKERFNRNWAAMVSAARGDRAPISPLRRWMIGFWGTSWLFRGEELDKVTCVGAVAVVGLSGLVASVVASHRGSGDPPVVAPPVVPPGDLLPEEASAELKRGALETLGAFAELQTWQERARFVRDPRRVRPLMEEYFRSHPDGSLKIGLDPEVSVLRRDGVDFVYMTGILERAGVEAPLGEPPSRTVFLAEHTGGDPKFRIDWELMVNYEPVPWEEFLASRGAPRPQSARFRVRVAESDHYVQPFMDRDKWLSYEVRPLSALDETAHAFVERTSKTGLQISLLVEQNAAESRAMVLDLRYPEDAKHDRVLEIENFVHEGWLTD